MPCPLSEQNQTCQKNVHIKAKHIKMVTCGLQDVKLVLVGLMATPFATPPNAPLSTVQKVQKWCKSKAPAVLLVNINLVFVQFLATLITVLLMGVSLISKGPANTY